MTTLDYAPLLSIPCADRSSSSCRYAVSLSTPSHYSPSRHPKSTHSTTGRYSSSPHTFPFLIASLLGVIARPSLPQHSTSRLPLISVRITVCRIAPRLRPTSPQFLSFQFSSPPQRTALRRTSRRHSTTFALHFVPIHISSPVHFYADSPHSRSLLGFGPQRHISRHAKTILLISALVVTARHISPSPQSTPSRNIALRYSPPSHSCTNADQSSPSSHRLSGRLSSLLVVMSASVTTCHVITRLHSYAPLRHIKRAVPARSFFASSLRALSIQLVQW